MSNGHVSNRLVFLGRLPTRLFRNKEIKPVSLAEYQLGSSEAELRFRPIYRVPALPWGSKTHPREKLNNNGSYIIQDNSTVDVTEQHTMKC